MSKAQDKTLWITAKFDGRCACKTQYYAGDKVFWKPGTGILLCADCCTPELWPKFYGGQAEAQEDKRRRCLANDADWLLDAWMLDESESFVFPDIGDRT